MHRYQTYVIQKSKKSDINISTVITKNGTFKPPQSLYYTYTERYSVIYLKINEIKPQNCIYIQSTQH